MNRTPRVTAVVTRRKIRAWAALAHLAREAEKEPRGIEDSMHIGIVMWPDGSGEVCYQGHEHTMGNNFDRKRTLVEFSENDTQCKTLMDALLFAAGMK